MSEDEPITIGERARGTKSKIPDLEFVGADAVQLDDLVIHEGYRDPLLVVGHTITDAPTLAEAVVIITCEGVTWQMHGDQQIKRVVRTEEAP